MCPGRAIGDVLMKILYAEARAKHYRTNVILKYHFSRLIQLRVFFLGLCPWNMY